MDFFDIKERSSKKGMIEIYPDFKVVRSKDLMVRAKSFYAIWDEEKGLWSTDEFDVQRLVDKELAEYRAKVSENSENTYHVKFMREWSSKSWAEYRNYLTHLSDNAHQVDACLTFANTEVKKKDYVTRRLPYPLQEGPCDAYEEMMSVLYCPEEREKLEWAIGAIVAGDAKDIQKFVVLFGAPGTGKSTVLNIIQKLFAGYYTAFEGKALTSSNNAFATEMFKTNPLVAIDHDSDLSKIEDNTRMNSIVSHEEMTINEKHKPTYTARANCFLFIATNRPVKISEAKSGVIRRLIDVRPTGEKLPVAKYQDLVSRIDFELGAIAYRCLQVYRQRGKNYYAAYRPLDMILQTDVFFNFVEANYQTLHDQGGISLSQAYEMYKTFCDESLVEFKLPRHKFREELKNYFEKFDEVTRVDGKQIRSYYTTLIESKFTIGEKTSTNGDHPSWLLLDSNVSLFDTTFADCPAQYANDKGTPAKRWAEVETVLSDIDTTQTHYVQTPQNLVTVDFDLKDSEGNKSAERNLEEASKWPPTYAEFSKSGSGLHLEYFYNGDVHQLNPIFAENIEIKISIGNSALRRKLSKCNTLPIATISTGLPLKGEEKKVIDFSTVKSERGLRELIKRNLRKEIHSATKPSIDFIYDILEETYKTGMKYDITDMRPAIISFAVNSSNQSDYCLKLVTKMKFKSDEPSGGTEDYISHDFVFFDVEVFPNLFIVCWKYQGENNKTIRMINPEAQDIEPLLHMRLIGFNCRRYDNHILYARYIGYDLPELFVLSQRIIGESKNALFGEAYNLSYADVYDYSSKKQSLKKFQIDLGIHHKELGWPWDKPIPEEKWNEAAEYCENDVVSLEKVFEDRQEDFIARQILAEVSGLKVNDTTQQHTARILFGDDPHPQKKFVYTDLSKMFPGYEFIQGKSYYRGEEVGEGGNVYAEPGCYRDVSVSDVISMHPHSAELLDIFGPYTKRFSELIAARVAIKHKEYDKAKAMLGGVLEKYLTSPESSAALAYALKIVINIVYGLTSAKFDNKFRDPRNIDNIVAKRGALFMIDLRHAVQDQGYTVCHIKTDSIKIPNATPDIIKFVYDFGKKYGYEFESEGFYDRFCLVNDAVYIARYGGGTKSGQWTATGAEFAVPYVFKTLFSKEPIVFEDLCEAKSVKSALYLDMNENLAEGEHNYQFVGKVGLFCPVKPGTGGGTLYREQDGKYYAVAGTKGYRWLEAETIRLLKKEDDIDFEYFEKLAREAKAHIEKYTNFEEFVS